ncbi:phosphate/phosphite/phosphonate ABC transporter substrate-binding protein [Yoonia sp. 2307UL14-13]|uniref:phosphate/phosphite/phosphonate ABC transporter substrate-binding protein n=1 Tax=Yoonia sp. 2307UL14-13 TaxID=3126506 RepID=UPI0030A56D06
MYARPWNVAAHDALWALIRGSLRARDIAAPDRLDHDVDYMAVWSRPDLVLGHICNLPYRARFRDKVTVIGASDYGLADCPAGYYRSHFVVRKDAHGDNVRDYALQRFATNDPLSQSGYGAAQQWAADRGFSFVDPVVTGSHAASIVAVAHGKADIAAIDAQTWRHACEGDDPTGDLRIIDHTDPSPGMTFITRKDQNPAPYLSAIRDAIAGLNPAHAIVLGLRGIIALPSAAYDIPLPPKVALSVT